MKNYALKLRIFLFTHSIFLASSAPAAAIKPLVTETIHLGGSTAEWSIFEGRAAHGSELNVKFEGAVNESEQTMFIRQDDVKQDWNVMLNGRKLGALFLAEADLVHTLPVPAQTLKDGENELQISTKTPEDILIHSVGIADAPKTNAVAGGSVRVRVEDDAGAALPARITILDENGSLAALQTGVETNVTARPGVVYTLDGRVNISLRPGTYRIYATRGPEYSLGSEEVTVGEEAVTVQFTLDREVNTTNWVAADTHMHTLTFSHHGDALLTERLITLAAEGIELPIATEHNAHSDYGTTTKEMGLTKYFTVVTGNEVTTKRGHFNIFPVLLAEKPIDHKIEHWPELMSKIRQARGVRVAILNHPTDTHSGFTPLAATNFNRVTGKNLRGDFDFTFDAMEVVNSGAMRSDWMEPFRCWFALLNRGLRVTGVGASDSHDVSRFIVGQGRTYIQGEDADPAKLNVAELCDNLKRGRAIVSLGLFPQLAISEA
ncbi:MAG: CehA/McbA family metallohydrolase, partial [Limisphaerales bacterium]